LDDLVAINEIVNSEWIIFIIVVVLNFLSDALPRLEVIVSLNFVPLTRKGVYVEIFNISLRRIPSAPAPTPVGSGSKLEKKCCS